MPNLGIHAPIPYTAKAAATYTALDHDGIVYDQSDPARQEPIREEPDEELYRVR